MAQTARLQAENIQVSLNNNLILDGVNLEIPDKKVTVIIGPNACGKSTLLRSLSRLQPVSKGAVILDGNEINKQNTKMVARKLAILPQIPISPDGIRVLDLVSRGRTPYQSALGQWTGEDTNKVEHALKLTNTLDLAARPVDALSGGQRQRVWIAMVLAQDTDLLLLDEPTTFLDLPHQIELLELTRKLNEQENRTVVMVLHDINLAARYADYLVVMKDGNVNIQGSPNDVITEQTMRDVFNVECSILADPNYDVPHIIPK